MLLRDVLRAHRRYRPRHRLAEVVGDGYLVARNEVCRKVRHALIKHGCAFSSTPPYPYYALPLIALEQIYETKVIPFVPNLWAFEEIERRRAGVLRTNDLESLAFRRNWVLHESCHLLFRHLAPAVTRKLPGFSRRDSDILSATLIESFADAVEVLAASEIEVADDEMRTMLHLNGNHIERVNPSTRATRLRLGREHALRLFIASSLTSQLLVKDADDAAVDRHLAGLIELDTYDPKTRALFRRTFRECFEMDVRFRIKTVGAYLRLRGHDGDAFELLDFDSVAVLSTPSIRALIVSACRFFAE